MAALSSASSTYQTYRFLIYAFLALSALYYGVLGIVAYSIAPSAITIAAYVCFLCTTSFFHAAKEGTARNNLALRDPDMAEAFLLRDDLRDLATRTGMAIPPVRVFDTNRDGIAACTYFSDETALVLSRTAIHALAGDGLEFAIGHELGHVRGKDHLVSLSFGPVTYLQGYVQWMERRGLPFRVASIPLKAIALIPSMLAFMIIQTMEYAADAFAAQTSDRQVGIRLLESRHTSGATEVTITRQRIKMLQRF